MHRNKKQACRVPGQITSSTAAGHDETRSKYERLCCRNSFSLGQFVFCAASNKEIEEEEEVKL